MFPLFVPSQTKTTTASKSRSLCTEKHHKDASNVEVTIFICIFYFFIIGYNILCSVKMRTAPTAHTLPDSSASIPRAAESKCLNKLDVESNWLHLLKYTLKCIFNLLVLLQYFYLMLLYVCTDTTSYYLTNLIIQNIFSFPFCFHSVTLTSYHWSWSWMHIFVHSAVICCTNYCCISRRRPNANPPPRKITFFDKHFIPRRHIWESDNKVCLVAAQEELLHHMLLFETLSISDFQPTRTREKKKCDNSYFHDQLSCRWAD